jgi:dihydroxy-acid dehydratase
MLVSDDELQRRRAELAEQGGYAFPDHQTPWQEIQRAMVDQLSEGMVLKPALRYRRIAQQMGIPRDNH